jgi:hypothetical protein
MSNDLQESEDTEQETESSDVGCSVDNFAVRAPKRPKTKNGFVIDDEDDVCSVGSSFSLSRIGIIEANCELRFPRTLDFYLLILIAALRARKSLSSAQAIHLNTE